MSCARDLRHSGSDILVEEDLTNVLGRCRISTALSSSFKTIVTQSTSNISLLEGIMLQGGPGPTIVRAFQEPSYFAMVVQLSLLTWAFEANYLATALADALRERQEGAPSSHQLLSTPDRQGILGVLIACEAQTSGFKWNMMLDAVSRTLGYDIENAPVDFPPFVLPGLLDMFPMVQTLPNDRIIHIQIPVGDGLQSGVVALIVWAHHVLNLTVLVRPRPQQGQSTPDIQFGGATTEQVLIEEVNAKDEACIVLLDSQKELLLKMKRDLDNEDALIGSVKKIPVMGWGNALFADFMGGWLICRGRSQAVINDMRTVTSAFAFIIARNLVRDDKDRNLGGLGADARHDLGYNVDEQRLLQASKLLFCNAQISLGEIRSFATHYTGKPLNESLSRPPALEAA